MGVKHILLLLPVLFFTTCDAENEPGKYVIGFSQCMTDDVWRQAMEIEMNIEASNYDNLTILLRDAKEEYAVRIALRR